MIKNSFGESIVGVIIGVFILSFIVIGITNLIINSKTIIDTYENRQIISIMKNNTINIVNKLDTSNIKETELFYLYKNDVTKLFETFTGSINSSYKYIDKYGNKVDDLENFEGNIYSRILWVERSDDSILGKNQILKVGNHQIIKVSIKQLIKK